MIIASFNAQNESDFGNPFSSFFHLPHCSFQERLFRFILWKQNLAHTVPFPVTGPPKSKVLRLYFLKLTCSDSQLGVLLLNLPSFGDLYVRNINYSANVIQLYATNAYCLASWFLRTGISYSPLIAVSYQNYMFFSCFRGNLSSSNFTAIGCLSNSTISVLATSSISRAEDINALGCSLMVTVPISFSFPFQYEFNGFDDDLMLNGMWRLAKLVSRKNVAGQVKKTIFITSLILDGIEI